MTWLWILLTVVGAWWLWQLADAAKRPDSQWAAADQNKLVYVLLMVLLGPLGAVLYVATAKASLQDAESAQLRADYPEYFSDNPPPADPDEGGAL